MHLVNGFCVRKIVDETIVIPTQEAARCLSGLASLNETGEFLFQLLQSEQTRESLLEALLENYDVDVQTATADVDTFIETLKENHMLENER